MRWWVPLGLLLVTPVAVCAQDDCLVQPPCAQAKSLAVRLARARGGPLVLSERNASTDVLHYDLAIEIQPSTSALNGSNTMTVRSVVDGLTSFTFRLDQLFTITSVQVGGVDATWTRLDPINVEVTLDRPYNTDETFELYVAYNGVPSTGGLGSINFATQHGQTLVFTLSEPWYAYTWWPAKDDLTDKTTADLWFTVPSNLVVISNGLLQGVDDVAGNKKRYRWRTDYQTADYLYCFSATNYAEHDYTWTYATGTMPVRLYIYPGDDSPSNRSVWANCVQMLSTFSGVYGLYPFLNEKYGIYEFGFGGGMEHQTMTGEGVFSESVTAHELSHQWWGDNVTCGTWHDIWLNEGFADYSEAIWFEYKPGSSGNAALHAAMANRRPFDASGTVYCYDISDVNRIFDYDLTYLKAGWVLHMLRHVIGDTAYFDTLAAWRAAYAGKSAITDDFIAVAESVSGRDLSWFFNEWVYGPGAPTYAYGSRAITVNGHSYVELYVLQQQGGAFPTFTMPIDIVNTVGGNPVTNVIWNTDDAQFFVIPTAGPASGLQFDPTPWILWTGRTPIAFVEGPPKIVTMNPMPSAVVPATSLAALQIGFHKNVVVNASRFTLSGVRHGAIPLTLAYDNTLFLATLTPSAPLLTDTYTLTVSDAIVSVAGNRHLDGELTHPFTTDPLPSGDGVPGGAAVAQFTVTSPGDTNCDGVVNFGDINPFVLALSDPGAYATAYAGCPLQNSDVNGDGQVNFSDINPFVDLLTGP